MTFFCFDVSNFPLIVLTLQGHPKSMDEMNDFLVMWQGLYTRSMNENLPYKLLFDVRQAVLNLEAGRYMSRLAEWLATMRPLAEKWMDRTGIICQTNGVKFFLRVLFKMYPPARPYKIFQEQELERAMEWIYSQEQGDLSVDVSAKESSEFQSIIKI
jgi:hypothetical protein